MSKYYLQQCNKPPVFPGKSDWGQKADFSQKSNLDKLLFDPNLIYQQKLEVCCIAENGTLTFRSKTPGYIDKRQKPHSLRNPGLVKVTF